MRGIGLVYVKDERGRLKSLREVSSENNISLALVKGRFHKGIRDFKKLIEPKYDSLRK